MSAVKEGGHYFDRRTFGVVYIRSARSMIVAEWVGWVSKDRQIYQRALQSSDEWPEEQESHAGRFFEPGPLVDFDIIEESGAEERLVSIDELRRLSRLPEEVCRDIELHLLALT